MSPGLVQPSVRRGGPAILLAGALLLTAAPAKGAEAPAGRGPMTAETLWKLKRLGPPSISPDGAWAAVSVTAYDLKEDKGKTDIWLVPTRGGEARRLTTHDAGDSNPAWSPDGQWILF